MTDRQDQSRPGAATSSSDEQLFIRNLIRRLAVRLKRQPALSDETLEDLEQRLHLHLVQNFHRYSPQRGHRNAFTTAILDRFCATVLRNSQTKKRYPGKIVSLSAVVWVEDGGPTELAQLVDERENGNRRQVSAMDRQEALDLSLDMVETIANLTVDLQELAARLKYETPTEIARDLEVPRTSLYEQIRRLRRRFEHSGLSGYLGNSSSQDDGDE